MTLKKLEPTPPNWKPETINTLGADLRPADGGVDVGVTFV